MKFAPLALVYLVTASIIRCETADACSLQNLNISRAVTQNVSIFTATGTLERTLKQSEVLPGKVVACNEALGLIQIVRADGSRVWIDPIDIKLPSALAKSP